MMGKAADNAQVQAQNISRLLMEEWDPIGVQGIPEAQDEYDAYVTDIHSMLIAGKSVNDVFEYLLWLEVEHMGLTVNRHRALEIAGRLVDLARI